VNPGVPVPIIWGSGEKIAHLGHLPAQAQQEAKQAFGKPVAIGYKYHRFHIYYCDFWTWDGEYVLFHDQQYWKLPEPVFAEVLGRPPSDLGKPFLYRFPLGLLILGGILLLVCLSQWRHQRKQRYFQRLWQDPRYQHALQMLILPDQLLQADPPPSDEQLQREHETRFAAALDYLQGEGIPPHEANANLQLMIATLSGLSTANRPPDQTSAEPSALPPPASPPQEEPRP
jgi:hypothetical protein